jgi:hypothetical protein
MRPFARKGDVVVYDLKACLEIEDLIGEIVVCGWASEIRLQRLLRRNLRDSALWDTETLARDVASGLPLTWASPIRMKLDARLRAVRIDGLECSPFNEASSP